MEGNGAMPFPFLFKGIYLFTFIINLLIIIFFKEVYLCLD